MTTKLSRDDMEKVKDMMWKSITNFISQDKNIDGVKIGKTFLTQIEEK